MKQTMPLLSLVAALSCAGLVAVATPSALAQTAASAPAPTPAREQVERRLVSAATLIEQSSGAKQVEKSGSAEAKAERLRARDLHAQAKAAFDGGDMVAANRLLDAAARSMMTAVKMSAPEQVSADKDKTEYEARLESTRALLDAHKRIAAEKNATASSADLTSKIQAMMADAGTLATGGKFKEAKVPLDQAYGAIRASIGVLRGGDTLVRSLNFATKEEEYHYEIDRNDTHRMLVQVLLGDRKSSGTIEQLVAKSMAESAKLRKQAEEQAQRREWEAGVKSLEDSTRELVRAIRSSGVYIPG